MADHEKCINVDLSTTHADICSEIALRATEGWKKAGIDDLQIQEVLNHVWPGIWPSFATQAEINSIIAHAATLLNVDVSKIKVDGIRIDGLVNLFVDW